jgi:hypothetical protein
MMSLEAILYNSINTETPQRSIYPSPAPSSSFSGQRGQDKYGHVDNETDTCDTCLGSGIVDEKSCPTCHGTGLLRNDQQEVESAYESAERSGDKGIINEDGPMVGRFDYPNKHKDVNKYKSVGGLKVNDANSTGADWCGIGQNNDSLFVDLAPYQPSLKRGQEKYGSKK